MPDDDIRDLADALYFLAASGLAAKEATDVLVAAIREGTAEPEDTP